VRRREILADRHHLAADNLKAFFLEAADDASAQATLDSIGLENDQCRFHGKAPAEGSFPNGLEHIARCRGIPHHR